MSYMTNMAVAMYLITQKGNQPMMEWIDTLDRKFTSMGGKVSLTDQDARELDAFLAAAPPAARRTKDYWYAKGVVESTMIRPQYHTRQYQDSSTQDAATAGI